MKTLLLGVLIALLLTAVAAARGLSPNIRDDMAVGRHPTT